MINKKNLVYLIIVLLSIFLIMSGWKLRPLGCDRYSTKQVIKVTQEIEDHSRNIAFILVVFLIGIYCIMEFKPAFLANNIDFVKNESHNAVFHIYVILIVLLILSLLSWYNAMKIREKISFRIFDYSEDVNYLSYVSLIYVGVGVFLLSMIFGIEVYPSLLTMVDKLKEKMTEQKKVIATPVF